MRLHICISILEEKKHLIKMTQVGDKKCFFLRL